MPITIDLFSPQQEPAKTVAEAAIGSCQSEMHRYMLVFGPRNLEVMREVELPGLIARAMQNRARSASPLHR